MLTKQQLARLKATFFLQDWELHVIEDRSIEACGECDVRVPYREAVIRVNPSIIQQVHDRGYSEGYFKTLYHEFGEVKMHEMMAVVPEDVRDEEWFCAYRDYLADEFSRIVLSLAPPPLEE